MTRIAPSILAADFGRLADEVQAVEAAGADWIHVDVMDGHFVPNLSIGPAVVAAVNGATDVPLDVHLMIEEPRRYIEPFAEAGADYITIHREVVEDLDEIFNQIEKAGAKPGVAVNPDTPVDTIVDAMERAGLILIMSVNPGFGAQKFMPIALEKLARLAEIKKERGYDCHLEVDGGIKIDNAGQVIQAGAEILVAGSAVFGSKDYSATISSLRDAA